MLYPYKMNFKKRLKDIADFLQPYQRMWQNEIMLMYPNPVQDYPSDWIDEIASVKDKDLIIRLEKKDFEGIIQTPTLLSYYKNIDELCLIDRAPELPSFPETPFSFLYVIPKKQHEIRKLAPFIKHLYKVKDAEAIVDIGGGIGLLAQAVVNHYDLKVISLDMDGELQETGKRRHEKNASNPKNKVQYHKIKVHSDEVAFREILKPKMITIGLHTCGPLANDQLTASASLKVENLINFGCCYHKLSKRDFTQNLSSFAKSLPFQVDQSPFCLTLASRAHKKMDEKDFDFKIKVKLYRYMMHFLLTDEYNLPNCTSLGNTAHKVYDQSFGIYALEQFERIKITPKHTKEELDDYFDNSERQELIQKMLAAGLIRNAMGRLLELYLLIDRAIFLEEQGYKVELMEFFDESISPRNIGIVAERQK